MPVPHEPPRSAPPGTHAEIGDTIIIATGPGRIPRTGKVIALINPDGSPPYVVRWLAGYETLFTPDLTTHVEKGH